MPAALDGLRRGKPKFTQEMRQAAIDRVLIGGESRAEVARSIGCSDETVGQWVRDPKDAYAPHHKEKWSAEIRAEIGHRYLAGETSAALAREYNVPIKYIPQLGYRIKHGLNVKKFMTPKPQCPKHGVPDYEIRGSLRVYRCKCGYMAFRSIVHED